MMSANCSTVIASEQDSDELDEFQGHSDDIQPLILVDVATKTPGVCIHGKRAPFRFILLFFSCMTTFGPFFHFDMPSVLQGRFTTPLNPNITGNCSTVDGQPVRALNDSRGVHCRSGIGLSETEFNLMYSVVYWTNAVFLPLGGFIVDKMGTTVGSLLFSALILAGSTTFSCALYLKGTYAMFPLLFLGRILFGTGLGPLLIAQSRIFATWFKGRELSFAFGCTQLLSGSALNFFFTKGWEADYGLLPTFIGATVVCGVALVCTVITCSMDARGQKQTGKALEKKIAAKKMKITDLKKLSSSFWLLAVTEIFLFNGIYPFVANASAFVQSNFHFSARDAAYIAGSVLFVPMVFAPVFGILLDYFGRRGFMCLTSGVSTIPVFAILAFSTTIHPLVPLLWLGLNYAMASAAFWPSFPLVVDDATLGTAMGLVTALKMISNGLTNLAVGQLLDSVHANKRWSCVMLFLLANAAACAVFGVLLNIADYRQGGALNAPPRPVHAMPIQLDVSDQDDITIETRMP